MAVTASDCELLIPHYRWSSYYCLAAGIAVIVGGVVLTFVAGNADATSLTKNVGQLGSLALSSVGFLPFLAYYHAAQRAHLLQRVLVLLKQGQTLSSATEALVEKIILESPDA